MEMKTNETNAVEVVARTLADLNGGCWAEPEADAVEVLEPVTLGDLAGEYWSDEAVEVVG
jgi:hypothetical protein